MADRRIFKYPLVVTDRSGVALPKDAQILCVQVQADTPCLWALVDPVAPLEPATFLIHGTGHPVAPGVGAHNYVGTFQLHGGRLVFHVFGPFPGETDAP